MSVTDARVFHTLRAFSRIYLGGIPSLITDESFFLSFVCVLAGTEALAHYRYPEVAGNGDRFRSFVEGYFPAMYHPHASDLWNFRNALVHAFSTGKFALTQHRSDLHLQTDSGDFIYLNAEDFYAALLVAAQQYFKEVRSQPQLQGKLVTALEKEKGGAIQIFSP